MKIVIPAAGMGTRMLPYTKYRNKALLRIGDKAAISHILDLYKSHEFVILLGYCGDQIREYCKAAHPELIKHKSIKFIEVDDYESDKASTLYSLSKAQEYLQEPFIFHACDTILLNDGYQNGNWHEYDNCVLISNSNKPGYTKIIQYNDKIDMIMHDDFDRNSSSSHKIFDYIGVCKVTDYWQFWTITNKLLETSNSKTSDVHVLNKMHPSLYVSYVHKDGWLDTGNREEYETYTSTNSNTNNILYKETEDIFIFNNNVVKFNCNSNITTNKIKRSLLEPLSHYTPTLNYTGKFIFSYKYISGKPLSRTLHSPHKIYDFLNWHYDRFYCNNSYDVDFNGECYKFYIDKTFDRIRQIDFLNIEDDVTINGVHVPNIVSQLETLSRFSFLYNGIKTYYHGDFVLDNIIDTGDDYVLIDWRDSFQGNLEYGDYYYDIAKFGHSLIMSHDMLTKKYFTYDYVSKNYIVDYAITNQMKQNLDAYYSWCVTKKLSISKIKLLMGLIWINMSPLHGPDIGKFLYRYGTYQLQNIMWEIRNK